VGRLWWYTPVIPALRQEELKFKVSMGGIDFLLNNNKLYEYVCKVERRKYYGILYRILEHL
jgi:hypothetical protein